MKVKAIIDTNVILSGLKSKNGFSYKILKKIAEDLFEFYISTPLVLEYEAVLTNMKNITGLEVEDITAFIDYICYAGIQTKIYYLWRPFLKDPFDDHLLELAVSSGSKYIVTFNLKDYKEIEKFGVQAITPQDFYHIIGG